MRTMSRRSLVQRLIAFLKREDALDHDRREPVHNPYDDLAPRDSCAASRAQPESAPDPQESLDSTPALDGNSRPPIYASRLDALVLRALHQFHAQWGFVIRYDAQGRMRYLTGRDWHGRYVAHTDVNPDRRALSLTLNSGQSQLFVPARSGLPMAVLCGPLRVDNEVVGALYLDSPARSRLYRGVFEVFCDQAARLVSEGAL